MSGTYKLICSAALVLMWGIAPTGAQQDKRVYISVDIEAVGPDTVAFTRTSMPEAYRLIRVLYRFINPD